MDKWEYQVCDKCGCEQRFSYGVTDNLWDKLPKPWKENNVLCIDCFLEELESTNPNLEINLSDFNHIAIIGSTMGFGGMILDNECGKDRKIYLGD